MKENEEVRFFEATELRADDGDSPKIVGYAAVYEKRSSRLGDFHEVIEPGAFSDSIKEDDIRALWNHDSNLVLGRNKSGTLALSEDKKGVRIEIDPPAWATAQMEMIRRGDVDQMSIGFRTIEDKWETVDGKNIRTLVKAELFDVSPVTFPAYPQTEVAVRSLEEWQESQRTGVPIDVLRKKLDMAEVE
jgi:HK97 family phage prohead protease